MNLQDLAQFVADMQKLQSENLELKAQFDADTQAIYDLKDKLNIAVKTTIDLQTKLEKATSKMERVIDACMNYMGMKIPYVFDYESLKGMDCSGMMRAAFGSVGIMLPRGSQYQAVAYPAVALGQEQRGDLIGIDTNGDGTINHIGLCLGNGQMIHTASPKEGINVCDYKTRYPHIIAICRPNYGG